jgi:hypothetical protein
VAVAPHPPKGGVFELRVRFLFFPQIVHHDDQKKQDYTGYSKTQVCVGGYVMAAHVGHKPYKEV